MVTAQAEEQSLAEKNMAAYFISHDTKYIAEDAIFRTMNNGDETKGREAIGGMLYYLYKVAFDAHAENTNTIVTENDAVWEGTFVGKHIGEFAGMSATGKDISVPLCVVYKLNSEGLIKRANIYMSGDVLMQQLTS